MGHPAVIADEKRCNKHPWAMRLSWLQNPHSPVHFLNSKVGQTGLVLVWGKGSLAGLCMQNYKSLCVAVTICATRLSQNLIFTFLHFLHFPNVVAQRHNFGGAHPGDYEPQIRTRPRFLYNIHTLQVSSSYVYSFGSCRADKQTHKRTDATESVQRSSMIVLLVEFYYYISSHKCSLA